MCILWTDARHKCTTKPVTTTTQSYKNKHQHIISYFSKSFVARYKRFCFYTAELGVIKYYYIGKLKLHLLLNRMTLSSYWLPEGQGHFVAGAANSYRNGHTMLSTRLNIYVPHSLSTIHMLGRPLYQQCQLFIGAITLAWSHCHATSCL